MTTKNYVWPGLWFIASVGMYFVLMHTLPLLHAKPETESSLRDLQLLQLNDGPYASYHDHEQLLISWICRGQLQQVQQRITRSYQIPARCGQAKPIALHQQEPLSDLGSEVRFEATRLAVLSDVHGQYQLMLDLLQAHAVIDQSLDWSFGEGHLVIAGDVMGRGEHVTETLWLLYQLDQQAIKAGGRLHLLLGNHETMVMYNDLRYLHAKYQQTAELMETSYHALFSSDTVLGRWLRSKPVLVQVNDMLIMHAGIHPDYLSLGMSMQEVNEHYRQSLGIPRAELMEQPILAFLYGRLGPLWFRGYFRERDAVSDAQVEDLLRRLGVNHLVVGHTSMDAVYQHFDGRVFSVDSSIKGGKNGDLLLWDNGTFYRGTLVGERLPVPVFSPEVGE